MARSRQRTSQTSWTSGELSPELAGRTDQKRYYDGGELLENWKLRPLGGLTRRPGTTYVATAKATDHRVQLLPFIARADSPAYALEFGEMGGTGYIRFYTRNGQIQAAAELATNGTFDTALTGWTPTTVGGGTLAIWDAGRARLQTPATVSTQASAQIQQLLIPVVTGLSYQVRVTIQRTAGTLFPEFVIGGATAIVTQSLDTGSYVYTVVAATTILSLTIRLIAPPGSGAARVFVDDVSVKQIGAFEIASPYLAVDLPKLRGAPSADVLYLACEGYAPRKLSRTSDIGWTLSLVNFRPPATEEKPITFAGVTLTLGAVTGTGITATATGGTPFLSGDVDRQIKSGVGRAIVQAFTSSTVVTVDIIDDFSATVLAPLAWTFNGSPNATLTPSKKEPKGAVVTLTATTLNVFRAGDVGSYVRIQNGLIRITKYTSGLVVTGEILHKLDAITGTTNWTLEVPSWDATDGYPVDVGFSSADRLVWARDDRIWLSVVGDYENMSPSTLDDDAFTLAMRTAEVSEIRGIIGATELQLFSSGAEFVVTGGNDAPITPTNFKIASDTTYGAARNRVIRVNGQTLFVDRSGRGLREQVFDIAVNRYVAVDLLQLSQHLFPVGTTITDLGYQRSPDSIVYTLRSDGMLFGLTYLRAEGVVGWWRMVTAGDVQSFCIIPHPDGDREQVWLAVRRTINGAIVQFIERIDDSSVFYDTNGVTYGQKNTDATVSYTGPAIQEVSGLGHLEGATVDILVGMDGTGPDERDYGQLVVSGGKVTLDAAYTPIEVGLHYEGTLITMRPEVQVAGTSQMVKKRNARIGVRLYRSKRLKANGNFLEIPPGVPYTGDVQTANLGWDRDGKITLVSDRPWPCTILMLTNVLGVGV